MHGIRKIVGYRPDAGIFILRLVVGIVFAVHGILKLSNMEGTVKFFTMIHIPGAAFFAWVVALVETLGGIALVLGIGTTIAAVLLGIVMIVAIFSAKLKVGFVGGYEFDLTVLAGLIAVLFNGAGKYSLDAKCKCDMCKVESNVQM